MSFNQLERRLNINTNDNKNKGVYELKLVAYTESYFSDIVFKVNVLFLQTNTGPPYFTSDL